MVSIDSFLPETRYDYLSNELKKKEEWVWNPEEMLRQLVTMIEDFKKNVVMSMMPMKGKAWQHHIMKAPRVDLNDLGETTMRHS